MIHVVNDRGNAPPATGIGVDTDGLLNALRLCADSTFAVSESTTSVRAALPRLVKRLGYFWNIKNAAHRNFGDADLVHFTNVYVPRRHPRVSYIGTIHDLDAIFCPIGYSRGYQ